MANGKELYVKLKADAKDFVKDFDKSIGAITKAAEKINLGSEFQEQLDSLKADINDIREFTINPNIDYTQISGLDKILERIGKRVDYVNSKINTHAKTTDASKIQSEISSLGSTISTITNQAKDLSSLVENLFNIKGPNENPFISDEALKSIKEAREELDKLNKSREKIDTKGFESNKLDDIGKYYEGRINRLKTLQDWLDNAYRVKEKRGLNSKENKLLTNTEIERGVVAKRIQDLQSEMSISDKSFKPIIPQDKINEYVKQARAQIDQERIRLKEEISRLDPLNLAEVTTFELKDGVIRVPVDLEAEDLRAKLSDLVADLKGLIEPIEIPLSFVTKGRKVNFKETDQYKKLVEQIDQIDVEGFDKNRAKKRLEDLAGQYSKAMTVSLKFEKTEAQKGINTILTEIKTMINDANIGQNLYEGIEKSLDLLRSEIEVIFGNNIIDNWAKNFISTIDLVCDRIDNSFKSITDNNVYAALKGWASADKDIRTSRDARDHVNKFDFSQERSAYGENERYLFANYKNGKTSNPYYYGNKDFVGDKLVKALIADIEKNGKKLGEQYDTTIHSHPISAEKIDGQRYEPVGYDTAFSLDDLKHLESLWEQGIRRIVVESNGMLNTLDLSMYNENNGKKLLNKIIEDYSKVTPINVTDAIYKNQDGNNVIDYSLYSDSQNKALKSIINKHSRIKGKDQILTQQTVDSLRLDVNQFSSESQEINNLTQNILRMAEALEKISSEGITSHATEDFFNKLHTEVDAVVQSVNNLAEAFKNVAVSAGSMSQSVGDAASNIDLVGKEAEETKNQIKGSGDKSKKSSKENPPENKINLRDLARTWIGQQFNLPLPKDSTLKPEDLEIKPSNAIIVDDGNGNVRVTTTTAKPPTSSKKKSKSTDDSKNKRESKPELPYDIDSTKYKANKKWFDVYKSGYPNKDDSQFATFLATKAVSPKSDIRENILADITGKSLSPGLIKEVQKEIISLIGSHINSIEEGSTKQPTDFSLELLKNAENLYMSLNPKASFGRLLSETGLRDKHERPSEYYASRGYDFITVKGDSDWGDYELPSMFDAFKDSNFIQEFFNMFGISTSSKPNAPSNPNLEGFLTSGYKTLSERKIEARNRCVSEKEYSSSKFARDAIIDMVREGALPFTKGINAIDAHASYFNDETKERVDLGYKYDKIDMNKITGFFDNLISMFGEFSKLTGRSNPSELKKMLQESGLKSEQVDELYKLVGLRAQELANTKDKEHANLRKISQNVFGYKEETVTTTKKQPRKSKRQLADENVINKSIEAYEADLLSKTTPYTDLANYFFGDTSSNLKGKAKDIYDKLRGKLDQNNIQRMDFSRDTVSRIARNLSLPSSNGNLDTTDISQLNKVITFLKEYQTLTGTQISLSEFLDLDEVGNDAAVADKALEKVVGRLELIEKGYGKKPEGRKEFKESKKLTDEEKNKAWKEAQDKVKQYMMTNSTGEYLTTRHIGDGDINAIVDIYSEYQKKVREGAKSIRNLMDGRGLPVEKGILQQIVEREHKAGYTSKEFTDLRGALYGIRNVIKPGLEDLYGESPEEQKSLYKVLDTYSKYKEKGGYETLDYLLKQVFEEKYKNTKNPPKYNTKLIKDMILGSQPYDEHATIKGKGGYYWTPEAGEDNKKSSRDLSSNQSKPSSKSSSGGKKPSEDNNQPSNITNVNYDGEPIVVPVTFDYAKAIEELKTQLIAVCTSLPIGFSEASTGDTPNVGAPINLDGANSTISDIENICKSLLTIFKDVNYSNDEYRVARDISESSNEMAKYRTMIGNNPATYGGLEFSWYSNSKTGSTSNPFYYDQSTLNRLRGRVKGKEKFDTHWHSHPTGDNYIEYDEHGKEKDRHIGSSYMFSPGDLSPNNVNIWKDYKRGVVSRNGQVATLDLRSFAKSDISKLLKSFNDTINATKTIEVTSDDGIKKNVLFSDYFQSVKNKKTGQYEQLWKMKDNIKSGSYKEEDYESQKYVNRTIQSDWGTSVFKKVFSELFPKKNVDDYLKIGTVEDFKREMPDFAKGYSQVNDVISLLDTLKSKLSEVATESGEIANLGGEQNSFGQFLQVISKTIENISGISDSLKGIAESFKELKGATGEGSPFTTFISDLKTLSGLNVDGALNNISGALTEFSTAYNRVNGVITDDNLKASYESIKGLTGEERVAGLNSLMSQYQEYARTGGKLKFTDLEKDAEAAKLLEQEYQNFISSQEKLNQEMKETPPVQSIFGDGDLEKFNDSITKITDSLGKLVVELQSFADMYSRVTGVVPGKFLEQDFANIQSSFDAILNDPKQGKIGNVHVNRKSFKNDLMSQYYEYINRGGTRSIEELTDDKFIKSKLSDTYASYLSKNKKVEVKDANLPSIYDEASLKSKINNVFTTLTSNLDSLIGVAERLSTVLSNVEPFELPHVDATNDTGKKKNGRGKSQLKNRNVERPDKGVIKDIGPDSDAWDRAVQSAQSYLNILNKVDKVEQYSKRNERDNTWDISYGIMGVNGNKIIMGQSGRLLQSHIKDNDYSSIITPYLKALSKSLTGQKRSIPEQGIISEMNEMISRGTNEDLLTMIAQKYKFSSFNNEDFRKTASSLNEGAIKSIVNGLESDVRKLEQPLIKNPNQAYFDQIERIRTIIDEISNKHLDLFNPDDARELQDFINQVEAVKADLKQNKSLYKSADIDKINQLRRQVEEFKKTNSKAFLDQDTVEQFKLLEDSIEGVKSESDLTTVKAQFEGLRHEIISTGQDGLTFFDNWKKRMRGLMGYLSTFFNFYQVINAVRTGIQNVRELDQAFIEMQKVSNDSEQSLKNFADNSFEAGSAVGATGLQMQKSAADWMRLGESISEAQESAAVSNELLQISEFEDIDSATQSLVAVSQAYRDFDKIEIVDKLNNVGNNFSISTNELAEGLQRASATLLTQGNTLDEAIALITAGNNTIQDSARVAAGLKTISLRIAGTEEAKDELAAEGEDTEDFVVMTSSKKRDIIKDYTAVASNDHKGVDILDENGNYKSTYEILREISEIYSEIQEEDKKFGTNRAAALIEELAGKNRSNIAAAILQNGELLEKVKDYSLDSEGSAQKELDKQLESLDTKIVQITNDLQELSKLVIPTDLFKGLLEGADNLLDLLNKIIGSNGVGFSGLVGLLSGTGIALSGHGIAGKNGSLRKWLPTLFEKNIYEGTPQYSLLKKSVNASDNLNIGKLLSVKDDTFYRDYAASMLFSKEPLSYNNFIEGKDNIIKGFKGQLGSDAIDNLKLLLSNNEISSDSNIDLAFLRSLKNSEIDEYLDSIIDKMKETGGVIEDVQWQTFFEGFEQHAKASEKGVSAFSLAVGKAGKAIKGFATSMLTSLAFSALFIGLAKAFEYLDENYIHKFENLQDKSSKAFGEYTNTQSELDDLNAKLEETGQRIDELQAQGTLTITEEVELQKLQMENDELERQIALKEELAKSERKEATDLTVEEVTDSYIKDPTKETTNYGIDESGNRFVMGTQYEWNTPLEVAKNEIQKIRDLNKKRQKYLDIYNDESSSKKQRENAQENLESLDESISKYEGYLSDLIPSLENARDQLADDTSEKGKQTFEDLTDIIDSYLNRNKSALEVAQINFEKFISSEGSGIEELKEKMALGAQSGQSLGDVLSGLGIDINDISSEPLRVLNEYFDELKAGVVSLDDEVKVLSLDIDQIASDESSALARIESAFGENASEKGDTYASLLERIKTAKELVESGDIGTEKFKSIAAFFSPTGAEDLDDWKENLPKISKYFTEDQEGVYKFMDDLTAALKDQGAKIEDGFYNLPDYFDADKVGKKLGLSGEAVVSLMGEAMDKGLSQDFFTDSEGGFNTLINLENELAEARLEYNKLQEEGASDVRLNAQKEKIEDLKIRIDQCTDSLDVMFKKFENNGKKKDDAPISKEDQKVLDSYTKRYNDLNNREWKTETERKQWEKHRGQLGNAIIQTAGEYGVEYDYNNRGQVMKASEVDASNKRLEKYASAIESYSDESKEGTAEFKTASENIEKWAKDKGLSTEEFIKRYARENLLTEDQLTELRQTEVENNTDSVKENTNAINTLNDAIHALAKALDVDLDEDESKNGKTSEGTNETPKESIDSMTNEKIERHRDRTTKTTTTPKKNKATDGEVPQLITERRIGATTTSKKTVTTKPPLTTQKKRTWGTGPTIGTPDDDWTYKWEHDKEGKKNWKVGSAGGLGIYVNAGEVPEGYTYRKKNKSIDLINRPVVPWNIMRDMGWKAEEGTSSTVDTERFDLDGESFLFTPILPNGDVFEKENFTDYCEGVIGGSDDKYGLLLGSFVGENAAKEAHAYEDALHKVQDYYFTRDEAAKKSLMVLKDYSAEELRSIDLTDDTSSAMEDQFVSLMDSLDISEDQVEQFINVLEDMGLLRIEPQVDLSQIDDVGKLNDTIAGQLSVGQSMTYTADVEGVQTEVEAVEEQEGVITYKADDLDGVQKEVEPIANQDGTITYKFVPDKGSKKDADGKKNEGGGTITQKTDVDTSGFEKGQKEVQQGVQALSKETATPDVNLQGASSANTQLRTLENTMNRLNGKKSKVTLTTVKEFITKSSKQGSTGRGQQQFNGTFHTSNAYAGGTNVSLSKNETALINELGEEIVVRNGKAMTFNNGYPTFAKLKRGDIIFNHKFKIVVLHRDVHEKIYLIAGKP